MSSTSEEIPGFMRSEALARMKSSSCGIAVGCLDFDQAFTFALGDDRTDGATHNCLSTLQPLHPSPPLNSMAHDEWAVFFASIGAMALIFLTRICRPVTVHAGLILQES
jgi:hypothetical protein